MILFPQAKINLGLSVLKKRSDGFHEIDSLLHPVKLYDILEIKKSKTDSFGISGLELDCLANENLVVKARNILRKHKIFPAIEIHLHKQIPAASGLGGGSSDAAQTLLAINKLFDLRISNHNLQQIALSIGSDCPFFLSKGSKFISGKGEILNPYKFKKLKLKLLLIVPDIYVSTKLAYSELNLTSQKTPIKKAIELSVNKWKDFLFNDFEYGIFKKFPELEMLKKRLYGFGAIYVSLSGSGSAVYALFSEEVKIELNPAYRSFWMNFPD